MIEAAAGAIQKSRLAVLLLPGIGTSRPSAGACARREDRTRGDARYRGGRKPGAYRGGEENGHDTDGFSDDGHMLDPEGIAAQARKMASYGADYINLADSAGALLPRT
jgi:4-hydroxy 2-oxovalerate aldolase